MGDQPQEPSAPTPGEGENTGPSAPTPGEGSWDLLADEPKRHRQAPQPSGRPPGAPPWSAKDVSIILALLFPFIAFSYWSYYLGNIGATPSTSTPASPAPSFVVVFLLIQWTIMLGIPLIYLRTRGYRLSPRNFGFRKARLGQTILTVLATWFLAYFVFGILYSWFLNTFASPSQDPSNAPGQKTSELFGTSAGAFILAFIMVALLTPLVEELFFRGIIHRGLEKSLGFLPGATLSATIFALAHTDYRLFVPIFVLGFGLAYVVHKTGSIWASISIHFAVNGLGVLAQLLSPGS
ncbi:MAG: CPBP family intramembrane glutamic endopeptidase [Thermoleophilia bacterium]